ncbi:hypothetical protein SLEP1_g24080 [Rubroshorea leprosula]|uniref:Uncharacterized protein n=1 Tax=Rubroshorea leprosula TaxID=152421 RepID=A0AAV5JPU9_9ROSI|nr:hypothetical protein SLEP1_g24080 [Rubroshorea leprosula]
MKSEEQARYLFGISLSDRSKWKQFLICSSGFFFGYLVNGICEVFQHFSSFVFLVWFPGKLKEKPNFVPCILSFTRWG